MFNNTTMKEDALRFMACLHRVMNPVIGSEVDE